MAKGMILAAGQGIRVRPLTRDIPKPMVPILGKPVMAYLIEHLARHGITEIMVNVVLHHQKIEEYFGGGNRRAHCVVPGKIKTIRSQIDAGEHRHLYFRASRAGLCAAGHGL